MAGIVRRVWLGLWMAAAAVGVVQAADAPRFKAYTVDVGTGLGVYLEIPAAQAGGRPFRIVYDTGKPAGSGTENDLVSFLTAPEVGLKPAQGDFEGDVIDYFVLSHPHEDHFNGAAPLFELFDVRNIVESKQIPGAKYLSRFKAPAVVEIARAKAAGKDAHYYVVGLPYPNGFDQPVDGKPYDEYALAAANLPAFLKDEVDPRKYAGKVRWPFGPQQVSQPVQWPVSHLLAGKEKALALVPEELRGAALEVDVIPVGTRFELDPRRNAGFTVVHGDTIAALDPELTESSTYAAAFPYYREGDLNDGSVSIQVTYGKASVFLPGDTEGRDAKPTKRVSLEEVFGSGEGADAYSQEEVEAYLRRGESPDDDLPLLELARPYLLGARDLGRLGYHSFVTYDRLSPDPMKVKVAGEERDLAAVNPAGPEDLGEDLVYWERRNEVERQRLHPRWRERLFRLIQSLGENRQKRAALKGRFTGWVGGSKPRIDWNAELGRFMPNWKDPVWTITNLAQLTERIYYVDPYLAHLLAGFIMRSDIFLEYMAPPDRADWSRRGEKHMLDVRGQILKESKQDVLKSDVLFFGHHGSFTSSSLGFVLAVDPNVGVISADDKSYSGSTLPDFSALFWNLNTHHPHSRAVLHSLFFHADMLAQKRGEPVDGYAYRNRFSGSASRIFRARRRWPIPIWRTDVNDDLVDANTLVDNIVIESDGSAPIWEWVRHKKGDPRPRLIPQDEGGLEHLPKYQYWFQLLAFTPPGGAAVRPHDPTGQIRSFQVRDRLPVAGATRTMRAPALGDEDEDEDWSVDLH